jgi:hypothetical protein
MTARPEVVALLTDFEVDQAGSRQRFRHRSGRPFTDEEADLISSATDEEIRAAATQLTAVPQRMAELFMPYIRAAGQETGDRPPEEEAP